MKSTLTWTRRLVCGALVMLAGVALGSAPMQKTQAPGYYRMMLGDFEVTALSDGTFSFNVKDLLTGITPAQLDDALARAFLKEPVDLSVNGFLVNTGTKDTYEATTNGEGYYNIQFVKLGTYEISITMQGFQKIGRAHV